MSWHDWSSSQFRVPGSELGAATLVLVLLVSCDRKTPPPKTPEAPVQVSSPRELFDRYSAGDAKLRWKLLDLRTRERLLAEIWAWQARLEKDPAESARVRERLKLGSDPWRMDPETLLLAKMDAERKPLTLVEARADALVVEEGGERREWPVVPEEGSLRIRLP